MNIVINAYAKINLSLDILGEQNGYHVLDTVMTSVNISDVVSLAMANDSGVTSVEFSDIIDGEKSNVYKAMKIMEEEFGCPPSRAVIKQNIPQGAGLGGSSADSAGIIRAYQMLYGLSDENALSVAVRIGSDVPFMLLGGTGRLIGTHSEIEYLPPLSGKVLLCGRGCVSTATCFAKFDERKETNIIKRSEKLSQSIRQRKKLTDCIQYFGNDLQSSAQTLCSDITNICEIMQSSRIKPSMTGSGSYVFGVGDITNLKNASQKLQEYGYKTTITNLLPYGVKQV